MENNWTVITEKLSDKSKVYNVYNYDTDVIIHAEDEEAANRIAKCLNEDAVD